jgi:hypothetical protein
VGRGVSAYRRIGVSACRRVGVLGVPRNSHFGSRNEALATFAVHRSSAEISD